MARHNAQRRPPAPDVWLAWLGLLGDAARVRLLRILAQAELGVGEAARVLQLPQSTVSRHLKPLHESGWVAKRTEGTASLYRLAADQLPEEARQLWTLTRGRFEEAATAADDDHRLATVLAERRGDSKAFFGRIGGEWSRLRAELFGAAFTDEALLGLLPPDWIVADIGCGTGEASERLAPLVRRVVAIDREPAMLEAAQRRLSEWPNVEFREGDLSGLPLRDREADAAVLMLVLHHVPRPREALEETARALADGGVLLVVDMVAHDREAWRHTMGHEHLGFAETEIESWDGLGGLRLKRLRRIRPDTQAKGPGLFGALFRREGGRRPSARR